jgi:hypothetical protein
MSVFLKAIDLINEHGWTKGKYYRPTDEYTARFGKVSAGYCILGACNSAYGKDTEFEKTYEYNILSDVIEYGSVIGYNYGSVINYNDYVCKNKEDVINTLRKAHEYECQLNEKSAGSG